MDKTNADLLDNGDPLCTHKHIFNKVHDPEHDTNIITITCDKCSFQMIVIDDMKMNPQPGPQRDFFYEALMRQQAKVEEHQMRLQRGMGPYYTHSATSYSSLLGAGGYRGSINQRNYRTITSRRTKPELHQLQPKRPTRFSSTMRWLLLSIIEFAHWLRLTVPETKSDPTPSMSQAPQPGSAPRSTPDPESQSPPKP